MAAAGAALTALTAAHRMPPALLPMFTFVLGTGAILVAPAYQSLVPDMIPRPQVPAAASLTYAATLVVVALSRNLALTILVLLPAGVAWIAFLSNVQSWAGDWAPWMGPATVRALRAVECRCGGPAGPWRVTNHAMPGCWLGSRIACR